MDAGRETQRLIDRERAHAEALQEDFEERFGLHMRHAEDNARLRREFAEERTKLAELRRERDAVEKELRDRVEELARQILALSPPHPPSPPRPPKLSVKAFGRKIVVELPQELGESKAAWAKRMYAEAVRQEQVFTFESFRNGLYKDFT
jgi:hypothetical protein